MLITLGALLLYTRSRVPLEYSSVAVLFVLVVAFELFPYRGPAAVSEPVRDVTREVAPAVTPEVAPDATPRGDSGDEERPPDGEETPADGPAAGATPDEPAAQDSGEVVLRGSDFLLGFGNEALVTICLLLVLAKGVEISGALRAAGRPLARVWLFNRRLALLVTLVVGAFVSAFANNTPVVVMMLPLLTGIAHRTGASPSGVLMPAGFATILGGMTTTIGTSTNLLVVSVSRQLGGPELAMFDFALPACIAAALGILYLWAVAPRLIPERVSPITDAAPRIFRSVIRLDADAQLVGRTLKDVIREVGEEVRIERVQRGAQLELARLPSLELRAGDLLHVRGSPDALKKLQNASVADFEESDVSRTPEQQLVEIVVTQSSPLHGRRLGELSATTHGKLRPVGLRRPARASASSLDAADDPTLRTGDLLLAQGRREDISELQEDPELLILDREIHVSRTAKAPLAIALLLGVVVAAASGIVSIMVSALCGAGIMLLGRCLSWDEAWRAIDMRLVLVIVTSLALGTSLSTTGAAEFLARAFVGAVEGLPPAVVISSLLLATALLTEVVTNNAVAVIATPIAIGVANQLGLAPTPFVLAVLFGANMSYLTPIGYQTNLLVLSAGGYRFSDFARAGIPLQALLWIVLSFALPMLYL